MTASVDGVGTVLVDSSGDALYSPSQEANGMIQCTGSCAHDLEATDRRTGAPTGSADVTGKLGTVKRPATEQVTLDDAAVHRGLARRGQRRRLP